MALDTKHVVRVPQNLIVKRFLGGWKVIRYRTLYPKVWLGAVSIVLYE